MICNLVILVFIIPFNLTRGNDIQNLEIFKTRGNDIQNLEIKC